MQKISIFFLSIMSFIGLSAQQNIEDLMNEIHREYQSFGAVSFLYPIQKTEDSYRVEGDLSSGKKVRRQSGDFLTVEMEESSDLMGNWEKSYYLKVKQKGLTGILWIQASQEWFYILPSAGRLGSNEEGRERVESYTLRIGLYLRSRACEQDPGSNITCWTRKIDRMISSELIAEIKGALPFALVEIDAKHKYLHCRLPKSNLDYPRLKNSLIGLGIQTEEDFKNLLGLFSNFNASGNLSIRLGEKSSPVLSLEIQNEQFVPAPNRPLRSPTLLYRNMLEEPNGKTLSFDLYRIGDVQQELIGHLKLNAKLSSDKADCACLAAYYYAVEGEIELKGGEKTRVKGHFCNHRPHGYVLEPRNPHPYFYLEDENGERIFQGAVMLSQMPIGYLSWGTWRQEYVVAKQK